MWATSLGRRFLSKTTFSLDQGFPAPGGQVPLVVDETQLTRLRELEVLEKIAAAGKLNIVDSRPTGTSSTSRPIPASRRPTLLSPQAES